MNKEYKIKLDLNKKLYNKKMMFNQFDENVNDFYIEITKNNEVVKDLDKSIITLVAIKPNNAVDAQFIEAKEGQIYANLKPSMCDLVGNYQAKAMIVLEGEIVTTDTINYSVSEDKIISRLNDDVASDERFPLFTDALARLSTIEISEEQRMINEAERILAEENRKIEEAKRVEAELIRQHEEADRTKYDAIRESNENIRKQNESIRLSNETNRIDEEAKRVEEENKRKLAEEERNANYNFMTEDEERRRSEANAHKKAEVLRVQAETDRVNEEAKRRTTEQARVSAENIRVGNENTRKDNEEARKNNETQRVEAETQRQSRYNSFIADAEANANNFENYTNNAKVKEEERKSNELDRKSQEDRRVSNEVERISNEVERISNENTRKANENARIESEKQRVDAENLRKEKIIEIQSDYDSLKKVIIDENASANLQNQINLVNSQLEHKANKSEVRLKSALNTLNDCDEEMLAAIQNKEGETIFELSSIPKDASVTFGKLDQDSIKNIASYEKLDVELQEGYYDNSSNCNNIKINSNYISIKYSCYEGEMYNCDCKIDTEHLSTVIFYKEDGTQLLRLNSGVIGTYLNYEFTVPKGAYYVTITSRNTQLPVLRKLKYKNVNEIEDVAQKNKDNIDTLMDDLDYSIIENYSSITAQLLQNNTERLEGKIYTASGGFQSLENYSTLYYTLDKDAVTINLKDISVGVYGGAFVTKDKVWISSFSTNGANIETEIPQNAYYIAISVTNSSLYGKYLYITIKNKTIELNKLDINKTVQENNNTLLKLTSELDYSAEYKNVQNTVQLLESNTEILEGKIYTASGGFQTNSSFSTLYYELDHKAITINLRGIKVGEYGGAFVTKDKNWISSFSTDGADVEMEIPQNAYYIAISVPVDSIYGRYLYITIKNSYIQFNNLSIDNLNIPTTNPGNHWRNKKILWLGTSVSFGQYATKSYVKEACDILECNFLNVSMPGLAIHTNQDGSQKTYGSLVLSKEEYAEQGVIIPSSPIPYTPGGSYNSYYRTYENVFNETTADYDLYVFDVVPNNSNFSLTDWNSFDKDTWTYSDGSSFADHRTTFLGALLFLMDKLYAINPTARIVFVLGSEFSYSSGKEALKVISDKYRIGIIDIWSKINLTPKSKMYIYTKDGTDAHPSTYAHELLGKTLANELLLMS